MAGCTQQSGCTKGYGLVQQGCGLLGNPMSSYVEVWGDGTSDVYPNWVACEKTQKLIHREGCGLSAKSTSADWVILYDSGEIEILPKDQRCLNHSCANRPVYTMWEGKDFKAIMGDGSKVTLISMAQEAEAPQVRLAGNNDKGNYTVVYMDGTISIATNQASDSRATVGENSASTVKVGPGANINLSILASSTLIEKSGCGLEGYPADTFVVKYWKDRLDVFPKADNCKPIKRLSAECNKSTGEWVKTWDDGTRESAPDEQCIPDFGPKDINSPDEIIG